MPQEMVYLLEGLENSSVSVNKIREWTDRDPVLAQLCRFVQHSWSRTVDSVFQPYQSRQFRF